VRNPYNDPRHGGKNNNTQINKSRKDKVEKYILDINNKLCELADFLFLDLKDELDNETIRKVKISQNQIPFNDIKFGDIGKKAIIDEVLYQEKQKKVEEEAKEAAGITAKDIAAELKKPISSILKAAASEEEDKYKYVMYGGSKRIYDESKKGTPPPKTDWKREGLSTSEKDKIINSLRANPKSSVFSKEFKWQPEEFLKAFSYLESSDKYNGQFIVSVVDNKKELIRYSNVSRLKKGINNMYLGKYVLLSMYDITAKESNDKESKHIYMGLKYIGMAGRLEFDCIGSTESGISNNQKLSIKEYLDAMDILYDEDDDNLKIRI
jgi:hypothetical protein